MGNTHQTASNSQWMQHIIYYMHDHIKYITNCILIEANIISVPFQTSYLYRFFGSYLRGLVSGFVERCSLDTLDLGNIRCQPWWTDLPSRHWYGDWPVFGLQKFIPQQGVCCWSHVVSNIPNCSVTEIGNDVVISSQDLICSQDLMFCCFF